MQGARCLVQPVGQERVEWLGENRMVFRGGLSGLKQKNPLFNLRLRLAQISLRVEKGGGLRAFRTLIDQLDRQAGIGPKRVRMSFQNIFGVLTKICFVKIEMNIFEYIPTVEEIIEGICFGNHINNGFRIRHDGFRWLYNRGRRLGWRWRWRCGDGFFLLTGEG